MLQSDAALEELAKNPEFAAMMNDPEVAPRMETSAFRNASFLEIGALSTVSST